MSFGENMCTWELIRREVLGNFAPETGLVRKLRATKEKLRALVQRRQSTRMLGVNARSLLGKGIVAGFMDKAIKNAELEQREVEENFRHELRQLQLTRTGPKEELKTRLTKGLMYKIHDGSQVVLPLGSPLRRSHTYAYHQNWPANCPRCWTWKPTSCSSPAAGLPRTADTFVPAGMDPLVTPSVEWLTSSPRPSRDRARRNPSAVPDSGTQSTSTP